FVIKHYADRSEAAAARMEQGAASLERGANAMLSQGQSLANAVVNGVKGQVANDIKQSVDRSIAPVHEMLGSDAKLIARIVQEGSTPKSRTVVKGLRTSDPAWRVFAASSGCGIARCIRTHRLLRHRVSRTSFDRPARA